MTDFSSIFHSPATAQPSAKQTLGVEIPTIEICDVGASIEGVERYASLVAQGIANVNGFEPDPKQFERLQSAAKPRCRYFPVFLGNGEPATFHIARYPGCSSLYEADAGVIDLFTSIGASIAGNFTVKSTETVRTTRLDDVPAMPSLDYLKIDVQGAELDVLKGASNALGSAVVIECEVEFIPLYKHQPLFGDVQNFLRERGFVLHKFLDIAGRTFRPGNGPRNNPFTAMSQVLWADAIFVRDFSRLERFDEDQLLKAAAILSQAYHSHDLVHYLLVEYDRRRQTQLAPGYWKNVLSQPNLCVEYMTHKLRP